MITIDNIPQQSSLIVINALGQVIMREENVSGTKTIASSKLPRGVNFIKVQNGKESLTRKVIVR